MSEKPKESNYEQTARIVSKMDEAKGASISDRIALRSLGINAILVALTLLGAVGTFAGVYVTHRIGINQIEQQQRQFNKQFDEQHKEFSRQLTFEQKQADENRDRLNQGFGTARLGGQQEPESERARSACKRTQRWRSHNIDKQSDCFLQETEPSTNRGIGCEASIRFVFGVRYKG